MTKKKDIKWKYMKLDGVLNRNYKVSDQGDIVVAATMKPLPQNDMGKKCAKNGTDYKSVSIAGRKSGVRVHRIVCETFRGAPKGDRTQVGHLDERKDNNALSNLKWFSPLERVRAYFTNNTRPRYTTAVIVRTKKMINKGLSNDAIAQKLGMSDSNVSAIKLGRIHSEVQPYTTNQLG